MNPKNERLLLIYKESEFESVNSFAKYCDIPQKTMDNYIKGVNVPKVSALMKVLEKFSIYNEEWLINGIEPKFNTDYVGNTGWDKDENGEYKWVGYGNDHISLIEKEEKEKEKQKDKDYVDSLFAGEILKAKERMAKRTMRRLELAIEDGKNLEQVKLEIKNVLLDLQDELA